MMSSKYKFWYLLIILNLVVVKVSNAWVIIADFESGTVGAQAQSSVDAFHTSSGDSKYVDSPVYQGSQSASVTAIIGQTGFGKWGGGFVFPSHLKEGDELWYRVMAYFPTGWSFSCGGCTEGVKFMRIHTASSNGSNEGYIGTLISPYDPNKLKIGTEVNPSHFDWPDPLGPVIERNRWHAFEIYIKFSSDKSHPNGIYRAWVDGKMVYENTSYPSLVSDSSYSDLAYLFTYWNNGAPKTQTAFVDEIILTNETPSRRDSNGNPYIGFISPKPPQDPVLIE